MLVQMRRMRRPREGRLGKALNVQQVVAGRLPQPPRGLFFRPIRGTIGLAATLVARQALAQPAGHAPGKRSEHPAQPLALVVAGADETRGDTSFRVVIDVLVCQGTKLLPQQERPVLPFGHGKRALRVNDDFPLLQSLFQRRLARHEKSPFQEIDHREGAAPAEPCQTCSEGTTPSGKERRPSRLHDASLTGAVSCVSCAVEGRRRRKRVGWFAAGGSRYTPPPWRRARRQAMGSPRPRPRPLLRPE